MTKTIDNAPRALELREEGKTWAEIGETLGVTADTIRKGCRRYMIKLPLKDQVEAETSYRIEEGDINNPRIQSLLSMSEVNLDVWKVTRAVVNRWGNADNYQAKVWLSLDESGKRFEQLRQDLLSDIRKEAKMSKEFPAHYYNPDCDSTDPHLVEISPFDIHIGKLGWGEEVGQDFDTSIAVKRFKAAVIDLLQRSSASYQIDEIVYPMGNDLMHIDNKSYTTTAGTLMDTDLRYHQIFRTSVRISLWAIRALREVAPVKVVVIPGNHDRVSMFCLGEVIAAAFDGDPLVTVDNSPRIRKYYRYGVNLIGYTHGDREKLSELPLIMADEAGKDWAETRIHEWHVGHKHNKRQMRWVTHDQYRTTGVRILPSLTGQDSWHYEKGYRHLPQAEAHVYSLTRGYAGMLNHHTPDDGCEFD